MNLRRFDTLFSRLFVLMWVTLLGSHFVAFTLAFPLAGTGRFDGETPRQRLDRLPPLGTLPPGGPFDRHDTPRGPGPGAAPDRAGAPDLPLQPERPRGPVLWLDYGVRALFIALAAALGARWLSGPMRRLSHAAQTLSADLGRGRPPTPLDEGHGTHEVRAVSAVFNTMARRLQEQFDARGMQMAALSHDLRTPLTRLRMRLDEVPAPLRDAASADIHEMSTMMDATLAVLREQRDGTEPGVLDLRSLLEAIVDDHAATGSTVEIADGPPARARARPAALRRVVDNLVGNALRYGGNARLAVLALADGVELTVDDTGPGIPEAQLELAFQPWVRLGSSADAHPRAGHGLGLAIARDLAERDGGRLTLANRPEGGLRARLWLPTAAAVPAAAGA